MSEFRIVSLEELLSELKKYYYKELHIHHTWRPNHSSFNGNNHIALQKGMRNHHVNKRGWSNIGQHITIMPDGKIVTGRDFNRNPASISSYNTDAFAVEMLGDFDQGRDDFTGKQKEIALKITNHFLKRNAYVRFHRENSSKTCPGSSIQKEEFIMEAKEINSKNDWKNELGKESIENLSKKEILNNPEEHIKKLNEPIEPWLFWTMIDRITD